MASFVKEKKSIRIIFKVFKYPPSHPLSAARYTGAGGAADGQLARGNSMWVIKTSDFSSRALPRIDNKRRVWLGSFLKVYETSVNLI